LKESVNVVISKIISLSKLEEVLLSNSNVTNSHSSIIDVDKGIRDDSPPVIASTVKLTGILDFI